MFFSGFSTSPAEAVLFCSGAGDNSTETKTMTLTRQKRTVVTRRLLSLVGTNPVLVAGSRSERSQECLNWLSTMLPNVSNENFPCDVPRNFLSSVILFLAISVPTLL